MVVFFDTCPPNLLEWIEKQHLFWVATAPLQADGHVNVSPKGAYDCFHVESPTRVWYEDLTGSGESNTVCSESLRHYAVHYVLLYLPVDCECRF